MASVAPTISAWPEPVARLKIRRRDGEPVIVDAAPGTPQSAIVVIGQMRVHQVVAFDFWHERDLERFRQHLYNQRHGHGTTGWKRHYITRAHQHWLMVMRVA